jgi:Uma2 family endonuclease
VQNGKPRTIHNGNDLAIVPQGDYERAHPRRASLVVEVADSSLVKDQTIKAEIYAAGAVPEYWIIDLAHDVIEVRRNRRGGSDFLP